MQAPVAVQAPAAAPGVEDLAQATLPGATFHRWLADCRQRGPLTLTRYAGQTAYLISGHSALAAAFRDNPRFPPAEAYRRTIEPVQGLTFQTMEDDEHRLYRRLATPAFRSTAVARMEVEGLAALARELLAQLPPGGGDFAHHFSHRYPFMVISRMLGIPLAREEAFRGWASGFLAFTSDPQHAAQCARDITDYLLPLLAERRSQPQEDVISALLHTDVDGQYLTDEEVLSHIRLLFTAGASTTVDALGNLLYLLLSQRERWQQLREQPALRAGAIEEVLRLESPVAILPRVSAEQAVSFAGVEIPAGSFCLFAIAGANRDPAVFASPDHYDPTRDTSRTLLSFGPGPRLCPGMHLARRQLRVVLDTLLQELPQLSLANEEAARPCGTVLRGPPVLPLRY
ncbi:cytochrome P450 [Parahaliea mediterranea]|uniref:cytochrome P450 n=1 Tax=Parahaliea mediterranea TaxID=651086 RepID=UPI000E2E698E|nr:cytochrome P450 [Parahaliea mediterranea]